MGAWLLRILLSTCKKTQYNLPTDNKMKIFVSWHCNLLAFTYMHRNEDKVALVSASKDGQLIAGPLEVLGFHTIRGSSSRNSVLALRSLLKTDKSMAITVDGPKGPPFKCKPGILYLAQKRKLPIICCSAWFSSTWQIPSWDKLRIPKPFSRISLKYHPAILIGKDEDIEKKSKLVEDKLNQI